MVSKACCCHQYEQDVSATRPGESSTFYEPYFYKNTFKEYNSMFVWEKKNGTDLISGDRNTKNTPLYKCLVVSVCQKKKRKINLTD